MRRRNTIRRDSGAVTSKLHFECMKDYIYVYRLCCTKLIYINIILHTQMSSADCKGVLIYNGHFYPANIIFF